MKISEEIKLEIQCFVYYFFKGTMAFNQLLGADIDYLKVVLADRQLLYNCFKIFAATRVDDMDFVDNERLVANYLVDLQKGDATVAYLNAQAHFTSSMHTPFWREFLKLAYCFCNNSFPIPLTEDYVPGLNGCGTAAVPAFAIWTNVLEVDKNQCPLNADYALKRANERLLIWDGKTENPPFAEWELEQEIY
ncbi:MAG TPA: hypothetical protein VF629_18350 [Hymenobacter sp.]|uniref:DUF7677 family protein n=1 Tax=Hymenobacter sp. TaxID=1898978 RepID=UPI002ED89979